MNKIINLNNFDNKKQNFLLIFYDASHRYGWFYELIEELAQNFNLHLFTNISSTVSYDQVVSCITFDKNNELNLNAYPNDASLSFFDDVINDLIKQFGIFDFVLDSPLRTIFYTELSQMLKETKKVHYVLYEPNFWIDSTLLGYLSLRLFEDNFYFASKGSLKWIEKELNMSLVKKNIVGIPVPQIDLFLAKGEIKSNHSQNEPLKIIIPSRIEVTKMYIISSLLDILKLIQEGFNIEVTVIGKDGGLSRTIQNIINKSELKAVVTKVSEQNPIDIDFWKEHDVAIAMGTSALITVAMGIPTIYSLPNVPKINNNKEIIYEYVHNKGFLGINFDSINEPPSIKYEDKKTYTYYALLKSILTNELDLSLLSNQSLEYIQKNIDLLRIKNIIHRITNNESY